MLQLRIFCAALSLCVSIAVTAQSQVIAPTPPMGWNSWDAYGLTIDPGATAFGDLTEYDADMADELRAEGYERARS